MNDTQSPIERTVMRRVRLIRILLLLISTATLAILTGAAALWGIGQEVWVARVFENMPQNGGITDQVAFWIAAFEHTRALVQVLTALTFVSLAFLVREILRGFLR